MIIIAHKGASGGERENTYEAFKLAWELGADAVETDLRKCPYCGRIALSHDPIDSLEKHKTAFLLQDFLSSEFAHWMDLHFEIKEKNIIDEMLSLTGAVDFKDHIIYSSFKWMELWRVRREYGRARIGLLWDQNERKIPKWLVVLCASFLGAESIHLNFEKLDKETVIYFQKLGFTVYAYTVNSEEEIYMVRKLNLDGIFTDFPDRARETLSRPIQ